MRYLFVTILTFVLAGCAVSKITVQGKDLPKFRSVAVLPSSYPGTVARERVDYLRSSLASQLKSEGYLVLEDGVTRKICEEDSTCKNREALFVKHGAEALVRFNVDSYSESNFLAGYVHTLKGRVSFIDRTDKILFEIEHATDDKGGLLFNSGQLVEAVSSQAKYGGKAGFSKVADEFIRTLASKIPSPGATPMKTEEFGSGVAIADVRAREVKPAVFEICSEATPGLSGILAIGSNRSTLREVKGGEYCGIFRIEGMDPTKPLFVEIRTPYGDAARKDVALMPPTPCQIADRVILKGGREIELSCVSISGKSMPLQECGDHTLACSPQKFNTYAATNDLGPYRKVKEAKTTSWTVPEGASNAIIEVLAIDERGVTSLPARAKDETSKKG